MSRLEAVTAGQFTSPQQYNDMYEAIHNGTPSWEHEYWYYVLGYSAHGHLGNSLEERTEEIAVIWWIADSGTASLVHYKYAAGSPIPGSLAFPDNTLVTTKVYPNPSSAFEGSAAIRLRPDFASQTKVIGDIKYAVLPAATRNSTKFIALSFMLPTSTKSGLGTGLYASFENTTTSFSYTAKVTMYRVQTSAKAISVRSYSVSSSGGDSFVTSLVTPDSPVMCKVVLWRMDDSYDDDVYLSHFVIKPPFSAF